MFSGWCYTICFFMGGNNNCWSWLRILRKFRFMDWWLMNRWLLWVIFWSFGWISWLRMYWVFNNNCFCMWLTIFSPTVWNFWWILWRMDWVFNNNWRTWWRILWVLRLMNSWCVAICTLLGFRRWLFQF